MAREVERATVSLLESICGPSVPTPDWLVRPGRAECRSQWGLISEIYHRLTGLTLPDVMRPVERRTVDGVFGLDRNRMFVFELDEVQHFNGFRATTLRTYPDDLPLAFDKDEWIRRSDKKAGLEGGGFARPKPPLFPEQNGRHQQRAFRDALCDIVPLEHGFLPTLRLGEFEVGDWIEGPVAEGRIRQILQERFG